MKVLLVEPDYFVKFAPLGLMRISSFHKSKGDYVEFVKGESRISFKPDKIYITSLFTYNYRDVLRSVRYYRKMFPKSDVWLGGILASTRPDLFKDEGVHVHIGLLYEVEDYPPDYSLFKDIDYSLTFMSKGCVNKCKFCCVPTIEGKIYHRKNWFNDINLKFKKIIFMDNNWLALDKKTWLEDVSKLRQLAKKGITNMDLNQSIDCRLFTKEKAEALKGLPIDPIRFSFDHMGQDKHIQRAIGLAMDNGFKSIHVDVLYNWTDTIEDFYYRIKEVNRLGAAAVLMKYAPLDEINRDYTGKNWTKRERDGVIRGNPYPYGQISTHSMEEFEYFFGKNAQEYKKLLNFNDIRKLTKLKASQWNKQKIWK